MVTPFNTNGSLFIQRYRWSQGDSGRGVVRDYIKRKECVRPQAELGGGWHAGFLLVVKGFFHVDFQIHIVML